MREVEVLVFDTGFYENHEDLDFLYPHIAGANRDTHGTHVAGIIGACFNNSIGISGVAPNSLMYGVQYSGTMTAVMNIVQNYLFYGVRVINISMGYHLLEFAAHSGNQQAIAHLDFMTNYFEQRLLAMIEDGFEFVICVSAGNQHYTAPRGIRYVVCTNYCTVYNNCIGFYRNNRGSLARVDGIYMPFARIQNEDVRSRIIIVGATQQNGDLATFSQRCDRLMDVSAPGVDIYSTYRVRRNWRGREIHEYESQDGTSMATPFVSGLATMLFGINPDFTGAEVKQIIVDTAEGRHNTINAVEAVRAAIAMAYAGQGAVAGADHAMALQLYSELLAQYQEIIENEYFMDWEWVDRARERQELSVDWLAWLEWQRSFGGSIPAYFAFYDINGNGIPDLILGAGAEQRSEVLGIHTWVDGEIHLLDINPHDSWLGERTNISVLRDGIIVNSGSSGALSGHATFFQISTDSRSVDIIDELWHDLHEGSVWGDDRQGFFRGDEQITEEEYDGIFYKYFGVSSERWYIPAENELVFEWHTLRITPNDNVDEPVPEQETVTISDNWQDWFSISFGEWFGNNPPELVGGFMGGSLYQHPTDSESLILFFGEDGFSTTRLPTDYPVAIFTTISRLLGRPSTSVEELRNIFGGAFSMEYNYYWLEWEAHAEKDGHHLVFPLENEHDADIRGVDIWRR